MNIREKLLQYTGNASNYFLNASSETKQTCLVNFIVFKYGVVFDFDFSIFVAQMIKVHSSKINQNFCDHVKPLENNPTEEHRYWIFNECSFDNNLKHGPDIDLIHLNKCTMNDYDIMDHMPSGSKVIFKYMKVSDLTDLNQALWGITFENVEFESFKKLPKFMRGIEIQQSNVGLPLDILNIFMYEELNDLDLSSSCSKTDDKVCTIVTESFENKDSIYECAAKLIENNLEEYATL